jgi:predicted RNase H-like HicB family nuclease
MPEIETPAYLIVIERADDGGYGAWAPDLPGCVALGETVEEAERQMREAVAFHVSTNVPARAAAMTSLRAWRHSFRVRNPPLVRCRRLPVRGSGPMSTT